ncbi:hypothetical protein DAPPUDRAFT_243050 [Daphnia pulex]|uniref:Uncharacterized protein n=1 Tax=Daphnia pulex TaxID=6669 RepID=E9GI02_DAPPU|nr:hypothetical protein DAPPUDRAFT_243050 [Daphnia pulex]|eukprot:EFX80962.1 hypothetical protein DAPPUDRAFT_243050 [Daphnia pulex]
MDEQTAITAGDEEQLDLKRINSSFGQSITITSAGQQSNRELDPNKNCSLCAALGCWTIGDKREDRVPLWSESGGRLFCLGFDQTSNARLPIGSRDFQSLFDSTAKAISKDGRDVSSREFAHEITGEVGQQQQQQTVRFYANQSQLTSNLSVGKKNRKKKKKKKEEGRK